MHVYLASMLVMRIITCFLAVDSIFASQAQAHGILHSNLRLCLGCSVKRLFEEQRIISEFLFDVLL